ncbi:hypothetical protein F4780DRAFT_274622 [Xylariomycetidae sp. FL0641]|nr:hypothetical protein F4780DRAFT_274622 [Xylariomycetidae sp. FL0641]
MRLAVAHIYLGLFGGCDCCAGPDRKLPRTGRLLSNGALVCGLPLLARTQCVMFCNPSMSPKQPRQDFLVVEVLNQPLHHHVGIA